MKLVAIALHRYQRDTPEPIILTQASELESYGYFQRNGCVPWPSALGGWEGVRARLLP